MNNYLEAIKTEKVEVKEIEETEKKDKNVNIRSNVKKLTYVASVLLILVMFSVMMLAVKSSINIMTESDNKNSTFNGN